MNPRFETINGKLCIMLEKPIPLTKDTQFPCIVRLIQDDSPMGGYNKTMETAYTLRRTVTALRIFSDSNVEAKDILLPAGNYNRFEIIGYPVADGSNDWALYQMMQGEKVCHEKSQSIMYCEHAGYIRREVRYNCVDHMSVSVWLDGADNTGWQLYKEPKPNPAKEPIADCNNCKHRCHKSNIDHCHMYEPKPTFKVGDWVEHEKSKEQGRITYISSDNYDAIEVKLYDQDELETYTKSDFNADFRKLSPSEVIVNIGCLSGTVERRTYFDTDKFFSLKNPEMEMAAAVINIDALDTPTRELVESLLKAQEEE